jgi:Mor family transcriptional regulator
MSIWFSEYHVRTLAERIAPKIAPAVERAILATVRQELPGLLMAELRDMLPEHTPKGSSAARRDRNAAIRAEYNGRNIGVLAAKYGISRRMAFNIVAGGK